MDKEKPMIHRLSSARRNPVPYLALLVVLAVGAGGGYAFAASKTKTITVCADKKTGVMHFKSRGGRCSRGQTRVTWNQQGPQGVQGSAGQAGAPAVSIWANVANNGSVVAGQGLSVQHLSAGTYQVTITSAACVHGANAPLITVSDTNPPGGTPPTDKAFPVAWYESTGSNQQFEVFTGVADTGSFTASDHTFTVMDTCM
jgi:hypothetical protein